jgi:bifunctional N6-L-threonylcarbamoyladenine synthase / protein kinase Bud32
MKKIAHGAEAIIYKSKIFNKEIIIKKRVSKKYRHEKLDKKILKTRNKQEAFILQKLKKNNLLAPFIYYVSENEIIMEYIKNDKKHKDKLLEIGEEIAKLHNADIIHGDLNLINILTRENKIYFIDFGLGQISLKPEDKATDLLVFKKTLKSLKKTEKYWEIIEKGYLKKTNNPQIVRKIKEIESRARYL